MMFSLIIFYRSAMNPTVNPLVPGPLNYFSKQIISRKKYSPKIDRHLSFKTGKPWNLKPQQALQRGYRFFVPFTNTVSANFLFLIGMLGYFLMQAEWRYKRNAGIKLLLTCVFLVSWRMPWSGLNGWNQSPEIKRHTITLFIKDSLHSDHNTPNSVFTVSELYKHSKLLTRS